VRQLEAHEQRLSGAPLELPAPSSAPIGGELMPRETTEVES
jgi:hypothetical protein